MQTIADTFRPNLKEWRDNRLIEVDPGQARELTVTAGDQSMRLERTGTRWSFADSGAPADANEVRTLLDKLRGATALNFESGVSADPERFGFDSPRGTITISGAGGETTRIAFGAYADPKTKRLVHARVGDSDTAVKLLDRDVTALLREPSHYRDRTVASVALNRLGAIEITHATDDQPLTIKLEKRGDTWEMTQPVASATDEMAVRKLIGLLGNFHAQRIVDRGDESLGKWGLDDPALRVTYTYAGDPIIQLGSNGAKPVQPEPQDLTFIAAQKDGKLYVVRTEDDSIIYELDNTIWPTLSAEFRKTDLFNFDEKQVSQVRFRDGEDTQGFDRNGQTWAYYPEPDIPIADKSVTNYLLRVRDIKVVRVIAYNVADFAAYGLENPRYAVEVAVDGNTLPKLLISEKTTADGLHYARSASAPHVFLLPADTLDRLNITLSAFEDRT
jgi:hypothetical protein